MLKLIKYEYRKEMGTYLVLFSALLVAEIYFLFGFAAGSNTNIAIATFAFVFGGVCGILALMLLGAISYSKEINSKYSYMTFMTPNSPYKIVGAKYISLFIATAVASILYVGFVCLDSYLILKKYDDIRSFSQMVKSAASMFGWDMDTYFSMFVAMLISMWIRFFFTVSCAYLAITLSTTILANKKGKGVLSVVFFFVITFIVSRITAILPKLETGTTMGAEILNNIWIYAFQILMIIGSYLFVSFMLKKKISL